MNPRWLLLPLLLLAGGARADEEAAEPEPARLQRLQAQFAPVDVEVDVSSLPPNERSALAKLVEAARAMDALFLRQDWAGNARLLLSLASDDSPLGRARLRYFLTEKGPWDRQEGDEPFIAGAPPKPAGANFYPEDATKEEIERWFSSLGGEEKEAATGFFTVVKRTGFGFEAVPYSIEYQNQLIPVARLLRDAAALTKQPSLKAYLEKDAAALLSNDYYDADVAWLQLDSSIEPILGPEETYEDGWFSDKAAFEAFIGLRDDQETAKLQRFSSRLQELEDQLPIEPAWRNPRLGALAPIRVVDELIAAGDGAHGVTTAAFNLPNDERVTREKGTKRVMLKNIQRAKFDKVLVPLARLALSPEDQDLLDFDAFFTHILMHELMHGLGPHEVKTGPRKGTAVRKALQDASGALEEAKADIAGLWALQRLVDEGVLDRRLEKTMYATFLASGFRTLRFGATEAHGKGMALQMNFLLDQGAFRANKDGTFSVDDRRVRKGVAKLVRLIMTVQAEGDYARARKLLAEYGRLRPSERAVLERARGLPIDIAPRPVTADALVVH